MKKELKRIFAKAEYWSAVVIVGVLLGFSLQFVKAWTEPKSAAPGGNVGAPINISATSQYKSGALGIGGVLQVYGQALFKNKVKIVDGTQGQGKVLTSDANGVASWQTGTSGGTCSSGYTYAGGWCLDNDGQFRLLRSATEQDAQYVPISTVADAKAVLIKVVAYANWRVSESYACVIPGNQNIDSKCSRTATNGAWSQDNDSQGPDTNQVMTLTSGSDGRILTKCITTNPNGTVPCAWYLVGYAK